MTNPPRVGVAVIITRDERLLLLKRRHAHGAGTWAVPGGHLEYGESPEDCAVREVREETDLDIAGTRFLAITNDVFDTEKSHYITIWLEARYVDGLPRVAAPFEASQVGWFALDALPEPLFLPLRHLLSGDSYPPNAATARLTRASA